MALGFCTYYMSYSNLLVNPSSKLDKVAIAAQNFVQDPTESVFTIDSKDAIVPSYIDTPAPFCTPIPALVLALVSVLLSIKGLFKQFVQIFIKLIKNQG